MSKLTRFSNKNRAARLDRAVDTFYDLIVIGGGITGAGIVLDAALRGLKTLLIEKNDFASGTSSKSTKLIHGGLRYLKQFEIGLVRETGLERAIAHQNACHLVHPEKMFLPIVSKGTFSNLSANVAISVYDWLASVPSIDKKQSRSKQEAMQDEPLLPEDILQSGIVYSEYRTDDARLTMELIKAAVRNKAEAFNHLEVISFLDDGGKVNGVVVKDVLGQRTQEIRGEVIVNATGPWVDSLRQMDQAEAKSNLKLSKGVHIVLDKSKLPVKSSVYFDAFDGRMIFAIPRGKAVYVGTTDTDYSGNKEDLKCTAEDAEYLLGAVNRFFNVPPIGILDIKSSWTGLRPLVHQAGKGPTEVSRKDEIFVSPSGLISIAGGKLTGFRKMAERILTAVYESSSKTFQPSRTKNYKLHHQPFDSYNEFTAFVNALHNDYKTFSLSLNDLYTLASNFGKDASTILVNAQMKSTNTKEENWLGLLQSQLHYCIEYESVYFPMDFLERRNSWLFFDIENAKKGLEPVSHQLANELDIPEGARKSQLLKARKTLANCSLEQLKESSRQTAR